MTEKCVVCGLRWHVCRDKKYPPEDMSAPAAMGTGGRGRRGEYVPRT